LAPAAAPFSFERSSRYYFAPTFYTLRRFSVMICTESGCTSLDKKLWKIGFFTGLTSFVLLILGIRTILGTELVVKNYLTFGVFSLTVGILASSLLFYKLKIAFWIFMVALLIGFAEFFRSFLMDNSGFGDLIGILSLFIISTFGFGLGIIVQFIVIGIRKLKE